MPEPAHERELVRYLRRHVRPFSEHYRTMLATTPVANAADLTRLPFTSLSDAAADARVFVLRPSKETISLSGDIGLMSRFWWSVLWRREPAFGETILDPIYKPVHWIYEDAVPLGYSAEDLERLAEAGRLRLQSAGVEPTDVIVATMPPAPALAFWQLVLGARRGGVPCLVLPDAVTVDEIIRLNPSVLAGGGEAVRMVLDAVGSQGLALPALRTVLVVGERLDDATRAAVTSAAAPAAPAAVAVVSIWAPPGVRSLWGECRSGQSLHTIPAVDYIEVVDPDGASVVGSGQAGEVVWTPIGWKGSVLLRLRTGLVAELEEGACPSCGTTSPRLRVLSDSPTFARVLDSHPSVAGWQAELRSVNGSDELIVYLTPATSAHPGALLRELDRHIGATQFVVLEHRDLERRLAAAHNEVIIDNRAATA